MFMAKEDRTAAKKAERSKVLLPGRELAFSQECARFAESLGVPATLVLTLLDEDDWSFLIKLHALIETALTGALVDHFGAPPALAEQFAISAVGGAGGKIKLAYEAELINKPMKDFLDRFAELRNQLVHSIDGIKFSLAGYVQSLSDEKRKQLVAALAFDGDEQHRRELLGMGPHVAFMHAAMAVMEKLAGGGVQMGSLEVWLSVPR